MAERLNGKHIMITGAAQGIGLAIAEACAREGAALLLIDRDADLLEQISIGLRDRGAQLLFRTADITDRDAIAACVEDSRAEIGEINALINNAGVNVFSEPLASTDEDWDRCFDINLKGAWNCCRAVLPAMVAAQSGVILNIASTHAFTIIQHTFPYPLAKHALLGMTRSLGLEYASFGIRVNALAPGYVATQKVLDYWNGFSDPAAAQAATLKLHPGGRIAIPDEIAMAAVFMISEECRFMNATSLTVDGGLSVQQHA